MRPSRFLFCGLAALLGACESTQDFTTTTGASAPAPTAPPSATLPPGTPPSGTTVVTLAKDQGLSQDDPDRQGAWRVATDASYVYWIDPFGSMSRVAKTGGAVEHVAAAAADPSQLRVQDGYVYYSDIDAVQIMRIPAQGGAAEPVTPPAHDYVAAFAVDGARVTWVDSTSVYRCSALACPKPEDLWKQTNLHATGVTTSGDDVFVPYLLNDPSTPGQWLDTGGITDATGGGQVFTLTVAYYTVVVEREAARAPLTTVYAGADHLILRADWPGSSAPRVLVSGSDADDYAYDLQVSGSYLYWLRRGSRCTACNTLDKGAVRRVKKDGSGRAETVWDGDDMLNGLVLDEGGMYLSTNNGRIIRLPRPSDTALP